MNTTIISAIALSTLADLSSLAATAAPATASAKEREIVNLSPFVVSDSAATMGRYTSLESISAGRVRTDIMDSAQSISVITEELIEDVAPGRIVDVARYVAGVSDSTLPTSWERTNMRGFQADGRTVDGFTYGVYPSGGFQNLDPAIIERIEIVKGPNSILAPQPTSPGGTINNATKKPQFRDFGVISLRWGRFDTNSGFLDVNRALSDQLAIRFVGSERKWDNWWKGSDVHSTTLMPGVTYRFSRNAQATVQYVYTSWKSANYFGLPIDPTSSSTTPARILAGAARDLDVFAADVFRATRQHELKLFFTAGLHGVQMRLAAAYNTSTQHNPQLNTGSSLGGDGGNVDPQTGLWNYGVRYGSTAPYAASPLATQPSRVFTRSGTEQFADPRQLNFQNDYAYILENGFLKSTSLAGIAYRDQRNDNSKSFNLSAPPFDIDRYVDTAWTRGTVSSDLRTTARFVQGYFAQNLALFRNRLILNAAESWQSYLQRAENKLTNVTRSSSPHTVLPSYGIVIKPAGDALSLYSAYTEQSSANTPSADATVPLLSTAQQREFGARMKIGRNQLYFTVSHFDITQDNFSTPNPGNLAVPAPTPRLPLLYSDRKARGWEYELRAHPMKGLSIIGSYTHFRNRDPNHVEFRGVAEKAGGVLASYSFGKENVRSLAGVRVAAGLDYLGNRPGDTPPNQSFTAAFIPIQPSFYLGERTLVNFTIAYDSQRNWGAQVNVDNAFDREHLWASVNRNMVFTGTPRNIRVSLRYSF